MTVPPTYEYAGSALIYKWYDLDERAAFSCRCGWQGVFREMDNGWFEELIDGTCPSCDTMLAIRSFATIDEIRAAAARGNRDAAEQLRSIEVRATKEDSRSP